MPIIFVYSIDFYMYILYKNVHNAFWGKIMIIRPQNTPKIVIPAKAGIQKTLDAGSGLPWNAFIRGPA